MISDEESWQKYEDYCTYDVELTKMIAKQIANMTKQLNDIIERGEKNDRNS